MGTARTSKDPVKSKVAVVAVSAVVDMKRLARRPIRAAVDPMRPKEDNMMFVELNWIELNACSCSCSCWRNVLRSTVVDVTNVLLLFSEVCRRLLRSCAVGFLFWQSSREQQKSSCSWPQGSWRCGPAGGSFFFLWCVSYGICICIYYIIVFEYELFGVWFSSSYWYYCLCYSSIEHMADRWYR